jgi:hypothetical protein
MSVAWSSMAWLMTSLTKRTTAASSSTTSSAPAGFASGRRSLVGILEAAGADAEVLDDELVDALGHGEVPDERPRGEGAHPVEP